VPARLGGFPYQAGRDRQREVHHLPRHVHDATNALTITADLDLRDCPARNRDVAGPDVPAATSAREPSLRRKRTQTATITISNTLGSDTLTLSGTGISPVNAAVGSVPNASASSRGSSVSYTVNGRSDRGRRDGNHYLQYERPGVSNDHITVCGSAT